MPDKSSTKVPDELLREIQRGNCVPLIGSGVAIEAEIGIPSAWDLALTLAKECERMAPDYHFEEHQYDPLDKVAEDFLIRANRITSQRGRVRLEGILQREVTRTGIRHPKTGKSSYPYMVNIPWQKTEGSLFITTNWDELLENAVVTYTGHQYDIILENTDLPRLKQDNRTKIIKLHGTIDRPETLIVTQSDYDRVKKDFKAIGLFEYVGNLLATRTVLFIGYSLRDSNFRLLYELVEDAINQPGRSALPTHYAILGEMPDANDRAEWEKKGIVFINSCARDFFRRVFIETNEFINRDEQRRLNRLEYAPVYAIVGSAGVGKSTLLRRINDDLDLERSEQARRYKYHLSYVFPRPEHLTAESRCLDLLTKLAKEVNYPLPDIVSEARRKAEKEGSSEQILQMELFIYHLNRLKQKFTEPTLLLFDCTTRLNSSIVRVLEDLLALALEGSGLHAIVASRYPLEWSHPQLKRTIRANTERLAPFTDINVADWLRYQGLLEANTYLESTAAKEAARSIIRLTQGHPEAIKLIMRRLSDDPTLLQDGQRIITFIHANEIKLVDEIVSEVVEKQILSDVDEVLREILCDTLCIFRKINLNVLEVLAEHALSKPTMEALQNHRERLLNHLMTSYMAVEPYRETNPWPMYAQDPVLRRLLARRLELQSKDRVLVLHHTAVSLFNEWAGAFTDDWQRAAILETLYHSLQLARFSNDGDKEVLFAAYLATTSSLLERLRSSAGLSKRLDLGRQLYTQLENDQEFAEDFILLFGQDRYEQLLHMIQ